MTRHSAKNRTLMHARAPLLEAHDLAGAARLLRGCFTDLALARPARTRARGHGPQRQRQDDAAAHARRTDGAGGRDHPPGAARPSRRSTLAFARIASFAGTCRR